MWSIPERKLHSHFDRVLYLLNFTQIFVTCASHFHFFFRFRHFFPHKFTTSFQFSSQRRGIIMRMSVSPMVENFSKQKTSIRVKIFHFNSEHIIPFSFAKRANQILKKSSIHNQSLIEGSLSTRPNTDL